MTDEEEFADAPKKPKYNPYGFNIPLTRDEIIRASEKKAREAEKTKHSLDFLMANRGKANIASYGHEPTPVISGYKMIKRTPVIDRADEDPFLKVKAVSEELDALIGKYRLPKQSERDEIGFNLGCQYELKKREQKAKEKER